MLLCTRERPRSLVHGAAMKTFAGTLNHRAVAKNQQPATLAGAAGRDHDLHNLENKPPPPPPPDGSRRLTLSIPFLGHFEAFVDSCTSTDDSGRATPARIPLAGFWKRNYISQLLCGLGDTRQQHPSVSSKKRDAGPGSFLHILLRALQGTAEAGRRNRELGR